MKKNVTKKKTKKTVAKLKKMSVKKVKKAVKVKSKPSKEKVKKAKAGKPNKVAKAKNAVKAKKAIKAKKPAPIAKPAPKKKFKKSGKTRYTTAELQHFKEILTDERRAILESAKANMKSLVDDESGDYVGENLTYSTHMAEQGTDEMEREKNYMFVQRDEKYLGYIQEALTRIDQGTYGMCIDCIDDPKYLCETCPLIPKERLELVPITQHCIECKNIRG
jgi:DnaK suppressor protein